jgi:hypothetical protein
MDQGLYGREVDVVRKGTLVYGFGINDADYPVNITVGDGTKRKVVWRCPYYQKWVNMLDRAYGAERQAYENVSVCQEWVSFNSFKSWMQLQDWEGKELDKDLLGDKTSYSPETCTFVSKKINMFLQLKTPEFYRGYWQVSARLPDKTRHKFKGKSRTRVFEDYINSKRLALSMLGDEDCPPKIRVLVEHKLKTFREENL